MDLYPIGQVLSSGYLEVIKQKGIYIELSSIASCNMLMSVFFRGVMVSIKAMQKRIDMI